MALEPGTKLGSYEILSLLGAGGMGEVYRARDMRLDREVAIKVLPAERLADQERRARFVREARAASALNHPNIVTIHEIESIGEIDFIVMEYLQGKTLDALIGRQGMRVSEVLRLAIPLADALARAHAKGIVHRDLKPANVALTGDGTPKILDFGLAKLFFDDERENDQPTGSIQTASYPASRPGRIAGTAGYMSPEQATAAPVDPRSDVFSFGAVLYEMVTGRRAFAGPSTAETLAAVIREHPKPPGEVVAGVPRELDRLIQRCLRKEPERRYQHMLDVKVELQEIKEESDSQRPTALASGRSSRRRAVATALATLLLSAAVVWAVLSLRKPEPPPPRLATLAFLPSANWIALSPDASQIAFSWRGEKEDSPGIYVNMIGTSQTRRLTTDPATDPLGGLAPSWSPDGRQIAFLRVGPAGSSAGATVHLVSVVDGSERRVSDFRASWTRPSWSPDGRFLAVGRPGEIDSPEDPRAPGIYLIPVERGEPRALTSPDVSTSHEAPTFSWDGRRLAYSSCIEAELCRVEVVELGSDYRPSGPPRPLTRRLPNIAGIAWVRDQRSILYGDLQTGRLWRAWLAADRPPEKVEVAGFGLLPSTSAAMDRLVFQSQRPRFNLFSYSPDRKSETLVLSDAHNPSLSPDDRRVAFVSTRGGDTPDIWLSDVGGSNPMQLTRGPGIAQGAPRWSPDGRRIVFDSRAEDGRWAIWTIDADGGSLRQLTSSPGNQNLPTWSRDGRYVYFQSDRANPSINVWRVPSAGGSEEPVTRDGGTLAYESNDGTTLFFKKGSGSAPVMALPLAGGPEVKVLDCVKAFGFSVGAAGVHHFACETGPSGVALNLLAPGTRNSRFLANVPRHGDAGLFGGLAASSDGKTILYGKWILGEVTPMMIENFR